MAVVMALALIGLGAVLQWWSVVTRAVDVTAGYRASDIPRGQVPLRPYVVAGTAISAVTVVAAVVWLASASRRQEERMVFERMGASSTFTTRPALVEGLLEGIAGAVLAVVALVGTGSLVARLERATIPGRYSLTIRDRNGSVQVAHIHLPLARIAEPSSTVWMIAVTVLAVGAVLGVLTAYLTTRSQRR